MQRKQIEPLDLLGHEEGPAISAEAYRNLAVYSNVAR
jgi:hypothetical protein